MYYLIAMDFEGRLFILCRNNQWRGLYDARGRRPFGGNPLTPMPFDTGAWSPPRPIWAVDFYRAHMYTLEPISCHV